MSKPTLILKNSMKLIKQIIVILKIIIRVFNTKEKKL